MNTAVEASLIYQQQRLHGIFLYLLYASSVSHRTDMKKGCRRREFSAEAVDSRRLLSEGCACVLLG
jgi:hypothetical protein